MSNFIFLLNIALKVLYIWRNIYEWKIVFEYIFEGHCHLTKSW